MNGLLILPNFNTTKFGTKAFLYFTITFWNSFQALFLEEEFQNNFFNRPEKVKKRYHFYHQFTNYNLIIFIYNISYICICFWMCIYIVIEIKY